MKKFKKIYIEITNRCNLTCSFCQPCSRTRAFMAPSVFDEILRKISGHTEYISLHVLGEPLLHPDLGLLLGISSEYGLQVNLTTNGTLLSRRRSDLLGQQALRQINISLHSFGQPGNAAALNSYLNGILAFIAAALSASTVRINLRLWNLSEEATAGEQGLNRLVLNRLEDHFGLHSPLSTDFPTRRGIILVPRVYLSMERSFTWPHGPAPDLGSHGYCRGLRDHIGILVDGTVVPCCLDSEGDIPLGNILQAPLPEILAGLRADTIRTGFARQQLIDPVCRRCTFRRRFHKNTAVHLEAGQKNPSSVRRNAA